MVHKISVVVVCCRVSGPLSQDATGWWCISSRHVLLAALEPRRPRAGDQQIWGLVRIHFRLLHRIVPQCPRETEVRLAPGVSVPRAPIASQGTQPQHLLTPKAPPSCTVPFGLDLTREFEKTQTRKHPIYSCHLQSVKLLSFENQTGTSSYISDENLIHNWKTNAGCPTIHLEIKYNFHISRLANIYFDCGLKM